MKKDPITLLAFTLAEVLIVLSIIGIIAEMTIPVLLQNVINQEYKSSAKNAYSLASQAITQMKNNNGGSLSSYETTANSIKPDFMAYFKVLKDCNLSDCVTPNAGTYKDINGKTFDANDFIANGQFTTDNGMFWAFANGYLYNVSGGAICEVTNGHTSCTDTPLANVIFVDINGYLKKPNTLGKDLYAFELVGDKLLPEGAASTLFTKNMLGYDYCTSSSNFSNNAIYAYNGISCSAKIMQGIDY